VGARAPRESEGDETPRGGAPADLPMRAPDSTSEVPDIPAGLVSVGRFHWSRRVTKPGGKEGIWKKKSSTDRTPRRDPHQSEPRFSPTRLVCGITRRHAVRRRDLAPGVRFPALAPRANLPRANLSVFAFLMGHSTPPRSSDETRAGPPADGHEASARPRDAVGRARALPGRVARRDRSGVVPPNPERRLTEPLLSTRASISFVYNKRNLSVRALAPRSRLTQKRLLPRWRPTPRPEGEDRDPVRCVRRDPGRRTQGSRR
jgi:hypothetical protein